MLFKRKGKKTAKPATAKPKRRTTRSKPASQGKPAPSPHGTKAAKSKKVPRPQPRAVHA